MISGLCPCSLGSTMDFFSSLPLFNAPEFFVLYVGFGLLSLSHPILAYCNSNFISRVLFKLPLCALGDSSAVAIHSLDSFPCSLGLAPPLQGPLFPPSFVLRKLSIPPNYTCQFCCLVLAPCSQVIFSSQLPAPHPSSASSHLLCVPLCFSYSQSTLAGQ